MASAEWALLQGDRTRLSTTGIWCQASQACASLHPTCMSKSCLVPCQQCSVASNLHSIMHCALPLTCRSALIRKASATPCSMFANSRHICGYPCLLPAGAPSPLGPSPVQAGINFALYTEHATAVTLVLQTAVFEPAQEFALSAEQHRTGHVWHALVEGLPKAGVLYGFKVDGPGGWETGNR